MTLFLGHPNMICLIGRERRISITVVWGEESDDERTLKFGKAARNFVATPEKLGTLKQIWLYFAQKYYLRKERNFSINQVSEMILCYSMYWHKAKQSYTCFPSIIM